MPPDGVTLFLDDEWTADDHRAFFKDCGYDDKVEFVGSVGEAEEVLARGQVVHLVSDWKMPGPDGVTYLKQKRQKDPRLRLSLLTGFADELRSDGRIEQLERIDIKVYDKGIIFAEGDGKLLDIVDPEAYSLWKGARRFPEADFLWKGALGFLNELRQIKDQTSPSIFGPWGKTYSVRQLMQEISGFTSVGQQWLQLREKVGQRRAAERRG